MRKALGANASWGWLALAAVTFAQAPRPAAAPPDARRVSTATAEAEIVPDQEVLREIVDPATGDRWLLVRNADQPAGPGRLVFGGQRRVTRGKVSVDGGFPAHSRSIVEPPLIRAGDTLIIDEHSAVVDARLEAVALNPAMPGTCFKARLKVGGKVVRVIAVSSGHAAFAPEKDTRP
jgi:hypothetical protein